MIDFRETTPQDLPAIMQMVAAAQAWFKAEGIDQWQDGYPTQTIFESDLMARTSYVGVQEGRVVLTGCLSFAGEPTYAQIEQGAWLNEAPYGVVHRLVVEPSLRGKRLAEAFFRFTFAECRRRGIANLRVDTHRQNRPMQRLLERLGFRPCGRIYLASGAARDAYQITF